MQVVLKANGVLLEEADVEVVSGVAALQVASHVHVVVAHDAADEVRGGYALGALGGEKLVLRLEGRVDVVGAVGRVGQVVVSDQVDLVHGEELVRYGPRRVRDDLVHVAAVAQRLVALYFVHDRAALLQMSQLVVANAHNQVRVRTQILGLHELLFICIDDKTRRVYHHKCIINNNDKIKVLLLLLGLLERGRCGTCRRCRRRRRAPCAAPCRVWPRPDRCARCSRTRFARLLPLCRSETERALCSSKHVSTKQKI